MWIASSKKSRISHSRIIEHCMIISLIDLKPNNKLKTTYYRQDFIFC